MDEVIALVGLEEKRDARVRTLSGGQQRRLDLGLALVGDPELIFLDEPTTGFDPARAGAAPGRRSASLRALGKTILLTTHYLDEAEQLADRVAVLREGEIVAIGPPAELTGARADDRDPLPRERRARSCSRTDEPTRRAARADRAARSAEGRELEGLDVRRPTLEEVYLALTEEDQE